MAVAASVRIILFHRLSHSLHSGAQLRIADELLNASTALLNRDLLTLLLNVGGFALEELRQFEAGVGEPMHICR